MKKTFQLTLLSCVLSVSIFAGDYPVGGKSCQPTPTNPCQSMVNQNENPEIIWREYILLIIKTLKLF